MAQASRVRGASQPQVVPTASFHGYEIQSRCSQTPLSRFEAVGLLQIIYLSLGDFIMLQHLGPSRGHTEMAVMKGEAETGQWCG